MSLLKRELMHAYQRKAAQFIIDTPKCALWLDMGLGKTITTATAIADLFNSFEIARVLIIAPLRVANSVWGREIKSWEHTEFMSVAVATGSEKERITAIEQNADVTVINIENVPWLVEMLGKKWHYDCVVIDEATKVKNPSSKRFKSLKKVLDKISRLIELTGTPSPNGLLDLWSQAYLIDGGKRLGRSMSAYKSRWFVGDYMGFKFTPREHAQEQIQDAISDIVLTMSAQDYLSMPDKIDVTLRVDLPDESLAQYKELEREAILQLEETEITALSAAALCTKLTQCANGSVYSADGVVAQIHTAKIDALKALREEHPTENLLIAYSYRHDLDAITDAFPEAVLLDKKASQIEDWNAGKIKMLLAHPASAATGLNLQHGGAVVVWYGQTWNLEHYLQFNARLHRQGQTKPVRIVHIIANSTIDEKIVAAIRCKDIDQTKLLLSLKS